METLIPLILTVVAAYGAFKTGKKIGVANLRENLVDDTHLEDTTPYVAYNQKRYDIKRLYVKKFKQEGKFRQIEKLNQEEKCRQEKKGGQ